ncbi:hypothetical protein [Rhizobium sp.]|uniref:hypothetical protein n=1 Tax=Rhizobium sp. TaxID=391 RepID=UPI002EF65F4C
MAKYKEEGVPLYPEVYLTTDVQAILGMLPDAQRLPLGATTRDIKGIKLAIKKSAPLAIGGWLIYLEDRVDKLNFGLLRGSSNPISVLLDRVLLDPHNIIPVTKMFQVADDCVEILNSSGERHIIFLNHRKDDSPPPLASLESLITSVTFAVKEDLMEPTQSYLTRVLYNALRISHGTLIAVTNKPSPPRRLFNDGMKLDEPIDFPGLIKQLKRTEIAPERLISAAALLEGMLNSDGIILFNDKAQLIGFNYFVKSKPATDESGGARRRAFATLSSNVGKGLRGAFIQSQDGWSDFCGV